MKIEGLGFLFDTVAGMDAGVCPACGAALPPADTRTYVYTCDAACHRRWIDQLVARFGDTLPITDGVTGKIHLVPTRELLEHGLRYADLPTYPEGTPA